MDRKIVLGTRGSTLARAQTEQVRAMLAGKFDDVEITVEVIKTEGDQDTATPLAEFGGRGAFVTSLEQALTEGRIDAAVHSLKDVPSSLAPEYTIASVPDREDPRDIVITRTGVEFEKLPAGSVIGTGSIRRRLQLARLRPDLEFKDIRGNIETRLDKLSDGDYDAVVLAAAAMHRLDKKGMISSYFNLDKVIPAPCQAAIGIECLAANRDMIAALKKIEKPDVRVCVDAERMYISTLGMGCHAPVAAFAYVGGGGVFFRALVGAENGQTIEKTIQTSKGNLSKAARDLAIKFRMQLNKMKS